ncbi:HD family phosphohydrolase [candidate division GN15 bacterium]|uniref:HD family phosphohydrolase n=1 Tax=candidate division GN15 bacterium TaxID=2072418 RepID=A0A855X616_9BACT|nr:MAG: HD family phosphohydrolase [candidate division GN15 bacterium]
MTTMTVENRVRQVVSNIRNLPTPPVVFHQIQKVLNDPKVSAAQVAAILAEDPAMSVKVLKMTNSAFYGLSREIESVKQAVVIIGMEAIRNLVLSASVLDMFKGKTTDQEFQEKFWRHSLATAFCSRILARKLRSKGIVDPDAAFSAGLLHDIGKIVLCCFLPTEYEKYVQEREQDRSAASYQIEEKALGYTHAQIGSLLAVQWKLPTKLGESITFHHQPELPAVPEPICYMVHLANYIAKKTFYEGTDRDLIGAPNAGALGSVGATDDDVSAVSDLLREEYLKSETFMSMIGIGK